MEKIRKEHRSMIEQKRTELRKRIKQKIIQVVEMEEELALKPKDIIVQTEVFDIETKVETEKKEVVQKPIDNNSTNIITQKLLDV